MGFFLAFVGVRVVSQDQGPSVTSYVGGGASELGGVVLRVGDYTVRADDPKYGNVSTRASMEAACGDPVEKGPLGAQKITETVLPVTVSPIDDQECIGADEDTTMDGGRLHLTVGDIGVIMIKTGAIDHPNLVLSRVDAQVRKTAFEHTQDVLVLVLLALGPAAAIGALVPLVQEGPGSKKAPAARSAAPPAP